MSQRFAGKVALISGAGSGIGRACALAFSGNGARVGLMDQNALGVADVAAEIGETAKAYGLDVSDPALVASTLAAVEEALGPVDILVNCAAIRDIASCLDLDIGLWEQVLRVNLTGPFIWSQAVARTLVARGAPGSIINISSVAGLVGVRNRSAYTSSKHGLGGMTKVMALELAEHNIRVNAIAPGAVRTPMSDEALSKVLYLISCRAME